MYAKPANDYCTVSACDGKSDYHDVNDDDSLESDTDTIGAVTLWSAALCSGGATTLSTLTIERLMGAKDEVNEKEAVFKVGFVCIMVIVAFVLYNDISKIIVPAG